MIEDGINHHTWSWKTDVGEFLQMNLVIELKHFLSLQNPLNQIHTSLSHNKTELTQVIKFSIMCNSSLRFLPDTIKHINNPLLRWKATTLSALGIGQWHFAT